MTPISPDTDSRPAATTTRYQQLWLAGTVLLIVVLAVRMLLHAEGANGPWYWRWRWNLTDPWRAYPAMALGLVPFLVAQWLFVRRGLLPAALTLVTTSTLLFMLGNAAMREPDFSITRPIIAVTENATVTGYLTDARRNDRESCCEAVGEWLRDFAERSPWLSLHNRNKPPGAVLYFTVMLHLLGERTALIAGGLVGMLAAVAVPGCFLLLRVMGLERSVAFHGASYLALCPGLIVSVPQLDPLYALFACVLLMLWVAAVDRGGVVPAVGFGLALAVCCFFTYNLLVLGAFIAAYWVWRVASRALPLKLGLRQGAIALLTVVLVYLVVWAITGYDPIRAFTVAHENQASLARALRRPYPATILYDLLDFLLGAAYVAGVLVAFTLSTPRRFGSPPRQHYVLVLLCIGQIALLALLGLLPTETLRVWAFLLPLLMVPTGLALGRFTLRGRLLLYLSAWLILAVMCQNMDFMFYKKRKRRPRPPQPEAVLVVERAVRLA